MKRLIGIFSLLLCLTLLLASCKKAPAMKYENGYYTIPGSSVQYSFISLNYEAVAYDNTDPLAILEQGANVPVYKISGVEVGKMVCTEDYDVLCAKGVTLPATLTAFDPYRMHVTKTAVLSYSVATVTDKEILKDITECYETVSGFNPAEVDFLEKEEFGLKFQSESCAGLYYSLQYWHFREKAELYVAIEDPDDFEHLYPGFEVRTELYKGEYYAVYQLGAGVIYDMESDLCYPVGDLLAEFVAQEMETQAGA